MIDTHCHIDDESFQPELDALIARQKEAGVSAILVPGINVQSIDSVLTVCAAHPNYLYPALGLHPEEVGADWQSDLARIREAIDGVGCYPSNPQGIIAIGEIGLDYYWSKEFALEQRDAFVAQLRWAVELDLPVMVHAREAAEDTLRIVQTIYAEAIAEGRRLRGVMHCFSGSREIAEAYLRMDWYLGIGGVITFKNCRLDQMLCPTDGSRSPFPISHLMLETDAPYMAPVPHRGKPNESRFMEHVVDKLSDAYKMSKNEVIAYTNAASKALFGVK